jgi:hypothetical protein
MDIDSIAISEYLSIRRVLGSCFFGTHYLIGGWKRIRERKSDDELSQQNEDLLYAFGRSDEIGIAAVQVFVDIVKDVCEQLGEQFISAVGQIRTDCNVSLRYWLTFSIVG